MHPGPCGCLTQAWQVGERPERAPDISTITDRVLDGLAQCTMTSQPASRKAGQHHLLRSVTALLGGPSGPPTGEGLLPLLAGEGAADAADAEEAVEGGENDHGRNHHDHGDGHHGAPTDCFQPDREGEPVGGAQEDDGN